ncbi:MAG TPA: NAD(P)-dependent oxidoreductase [Jatrophihabitans sp.]|nr:NAD(P)-dependent oxidoreductase [Jatrophihabitans sp.]
MRVLVAGATGVIGRQLTPLLASVGHEVFAFSRPGKPGSAVEDLGARAVVGDLLDANGVAQAVRNLRPEAVVHMATAIPAQINPRKMASDFAMTNRLRTEGTRNLLAAAHEVGVQRVISQGLAYAYDPNGNGLANEDAPLWLNPPKQFAPVLDALRELEQQTTTAGGLVLRFGHLYGPGSIYAADGSFTQQVRAGKVPLVGGGTSVFSFTHAHDAATAVVAALDKDVTGVLNIVDDEPSPMSVWLPEFADLLGAKKPKAAPAFMAKMAVGEWGVAFMTRLRGADGARAQLTLDWKPRYGSWRTGFAEELGAAAKRG